MTSNSPRSANSECGMWGDAMAITTTDTRRALIGVAPLVALGRYFGFCSRCAGGVALESVHAVCNMEIGGNENGWTLSAWIFGS